MGRASRVSSSRRETGRRSTAGPPRDSSPGGPAPARAATLLEILARPPSSVAPSLRRPNARSIPASRLCSIVVGRAERAGGDRHVDVVLVGIARDRRQDADDRVRPVVHAEDLADDLGIAAEAPHPVLVREHEDGFGAVLVLAPGRNVRPRMGLHAHEVEEVRRDDAGLRRARARAARAGRTTSSGTRRSRAKLRGEFWRSVISRGENAPSVDAGAGRIDLDADEAVAAPVRKRLQQHAVDDREDRRVRADAERQRQDRGRGVARVLAQRRAARSARPGGRSRGGRRGSASRTPPWSSRRRRSGREPRGAPPRASSRGAGSPRFRGRCGSAISSSSSPLHALARDRRD